MTQNNIRNFCSIARRMFGYVYCSHYQVIVLKLRKKSTDPTQSVLPQSSPDEMLAQNELLLYNQTDSARAHRAYIAAEFGISSWPEGGRFHVGLQGQRNDRPERYENGPLWPDTFYTISLRAFADTEGLCHNVCYLTIP